MRVSFLSHLALDPSSGLCKLRVCDASGLLAQDISKKIQNAPRNCFFWVLASLLHKTFNLVPSFFSSFSKWGATILYLIANIFSILTRSSIYSFYFSNGLYQSLPFFSVSFLSVSALCQCLLLSVSALCQCLLLSVSPSCQSLPFVSLCPLSVSPSCQSLPFVSVSFLSVSALC